MAEVTIKAYTRKSKSGKSFTVRSYTRRVGRKGHISPKEYKTGSNSPGDELRTKILTKSNTRKFTPEEIAEHREIKEGFKRADAERKSLGMSPEQYSRYVLKKERIKNNSKTQTSATTKNPMREKGLMQIFNRAETRIAKFVEKYGGKYKKTSK